MVGWCRGLQRLQGWGALSAADVAEACRLARQVLEAERDDAETVRQAAWALFVLAGEAAMAAAALDRALALNPNAAHAWSVRGIIHVARNQPDAAIEAIERARRLSPFDPTELSRMLAIYPKLTIAGFREYAHFMALEVVELYVAGLRLAGLPEE